MHGGARESDTTGDLHQQIARLGQRGPDAQVDGANSVLPALSAYAGGAI